MVVPTRSWSNVWILAALHALLFALAFPPLDFWFLSLIALVPLSIAATTASSTRRALIPVYVTQFGLWLWLLRWIVPVTAVGYPFLALYMSIWPTIFVWILRRVGRTSNFSTLPLTILLPILWTGVEYFRGDILFYGYPWYLLGHPLIAVPAMVQSADLFGTYFISFLAAMVSGSIIDALRVRWPGLITTNEQVQSRQKSKVLAGTVLFVFVAWAANVSYGLWRMNQALPLTPGPRILAIQTNLPQDNKLGWSAEQQARDVPDFMTLTQAAIKKIDRQPDLIVWPETMVPGLGMEAQTLDTLRDLTENYQWDLRHLYRWDLAVIDYQRELGIPMLVGSEAWVGTEPISEGNKVRLQPKRTYNSAFLIQGDPPYQRYDKYFLTPFGETMPYISSWPWLENQFLRIGVGANLSFDLDSNPEIAILKLRYDENRIAALATPICFEDTVARFCRRMVYADGQKRVDAFVNISNDGWFNSSVADRRLHAQIARFRTIENRVPMIRSVNTGMSMAIDSCGRIVDAIGEGYGTALQAGWVSDRVMTDARHTLYGRIGELWPFLCLILTSASLVWSFLLRRRAATPG